MICLFLQLFPTHFINFIIHSAFSVVFSGQTIYNAILHEPSLEVVFVWNRSKDILRAVGGLALDNLEDFAEREPDLVVEVAHPSITAQVSGISLLMHIFLSNLYLTLSCLWISVLLPVCGWALLSKFTCVKHIPALHFFTIILARFSRCQVRFIIRHSLE